MKRFYRRYMKKSKKIIGITLGIIGFFIVIKFIPIELVLLALGMGLLIMGVLILRIK